MNYTFFISIVCFAFGTTFFFSRSRNFKKFKKSTHLQVWAIKAAKSSAVQVLSFSLFYSITRSASISLPFSILSSFIPNLLRKSSHKRLLQARDKAWPLVVDQLASATASGVALHSALLEMDARGPKVLSKEFAAFNETFRSSGSLEKSIDDFALVAGKNFRRLQLESGLRQRKISTSMDPIAERIKSTILLAREYGGSEVGLLLRNLSSLLRQRERTQNEISIKQEWIKNSAVLASVTPWVLLLVLSFQTQTIEAYNQVGGRLVLLTGLVLTGFAYLWISKISESVAI